MDTPPQIPPQTEGPLRALIAALRERRPLFFTGEVLVQLDAELGDQVAEGQATMVLDAEDLAAVEQLLRPERKCRECGCAERNACVLPGNALIGVPPTTCRWAEFDLCSACVANASPRWQHPAGRMAA